MRALLLSLIPTSAALLSIYLNRQNYKRLNRGLDRFVATIDASIDRLGATMDASIDRLEKALERVSQLTAHHNEPAA